MFLSPFPIQEPGCVRFSASWIFPGILYAFPPFFPIPRVLGKFRKDYCLLLFVAPSWPRTSWHRPPSVLTKHSPTTITTGSAQQGQFVHLCPELFLFRLVFLQRRLGKRFTPTASKFLASACGLHRLGCMMPNGVPLLGGSKGHEIL